MGYDWLDCSILLQFLVIALLTWLLISSTFNGLVKSLEKWLNSRLTFFEIFEYNLNWFCSSLATLSHSLEDITSWGYSHHTETVLTIEELRDQLNCCFTCGVSWADSHVSLDCSECGGYAMNRPCPKCEGACGAIWKRDLSMVSSAAWCLCFGYVPTSYV